MVFVPQNAQNRGGEGGEAKLDEPICAMRGDDSFFVQTDQPSDEEFQVSRKTLIERCEAATEEPAQHGQRARQPAARVRLK